MENELDPLPSVLPPEGVVVTRLAAIAANPAPRVDVAGVRGSADAAVVAALAGADTQARIVVVAEDSEAATRLAADIAFLLGKKAGDEEEEAGDAVLVLAMPEASPYADQNPDRRGAMGRMATLAHLATKQPWNVLVVPPSALIRKVVPPAALVLGTKRVVKDAELNRDILVRDLLDAGWLRVPVVEDPGSFAVRGSILDVWPPGRDEPVRIELYGDLVETLKPFDPNTQTTAGAELGEVWLAPARDAILEKGNVARAKRRIANLADMIDWPTMKTRLLIDDVATGRAFFGADGFMPAYYEELAPLESYLPESARFVLTAPVAITQAVKAEIQRANEDLASKQAEPSFIFGAHYLDEAEGAASLARFPVVALHVTRAVVLGGDGRVGRGVRAVGRRRTTRFTSPRSTMTTSRARSKRHAKRRANRTR